MRQVQLKQPLPSVRVWAPHPEPVTPERSGGRPAATDLAVAGLRHPSFSSGRDSAGTARTTHPTSGADCPSSAVTVISPRTVSGFGHHLLRRRAHQARTSPPECPKRTPSSPINPSNAPWTYTTFRETATLLWSTEDGLVAAWSNTGVDPREPGWCSCLRNSRQRLGHGRSWKRWGLGAFSCVGGCQPRGVVMVGTTIDAWHFGQSSWTPALFDDTLNSWPQCWQEKRNGIVTEPNPDASDDPFSS